MSGLQVTSVNISSSRARSVLRLLWTTTFINNMDRKYRLIARAPRGDAEKSQRADPQDREEILHIPRVATKH